MIPSQWYPWQAVTINGRKFVVYDEDGLVISGTGGQAFYEKQCARCQRIFIVSNLTLLGSRKYCGLACTNAAKKDYYRLRKIRALLQGT